MSPPGPVLDRYDGVLLDLDGTVYREGQVLASATQALTRLRVAGVDTGFVTNNAARSAGEIADALAAGGITATAQQIVTSAQGAARLLGTRLPPGSRVLVVGTEALRADVAAAGLRPVGTHRDRPAAVVQGHSEQTGWARLAEACLALRGGACWVACNRDPTLPTAPGEVPGNGAMVAALVTATGREPAVAGKPERALLDAAMARLGLHRPLVVGDRLDTDIAAAHTAGLESLLVLSGVTRPVDVLAAPAGRRPTHLARDLAGLTGEPDRLRIEEPDPARRLGWRCRATGDRLVLHATDHAGDEVQALRVLCSHWWARAEGIPTLAAADPIAAAALSRLTPA